MAEEWQARRARKPIETLETLAALQPAIAELPGDVVLVGAQDIDAEQTVTLDQGEGRCLPVDADQQAGRRGAERRQGRHGHAGDIIPTAGGDDADATSEATHDRTELLLDFVSLIHEMEVRSGHLSSPSISFSFRLSSGRLFSEKAFTR